MKHIAIILAGGTGSRVGGQTPKQLLPLEDGRSILEHSVDAFEAAECIDEIAIVMHPEWMDEARQLCERNGWEKVQKIIPGGNERWESSWHAILAYMDETDAALWLHDAARPFVSQRILADVAQALEEHEAVTVAVPVTDTLYKVKGERLKVKVNSVPSRSEYMRAQTPQAFHLEVVAEFASKHPIYIVMGEETNKKITYKEDL